MDNKSQVKMGTTAAQRKLFFNLRKEAERLLAEYDRVDTKMLAENLDVREKDVIEMQQRLSSPDVSLDAPIQQGDDNSSTRLDFLKSDVVTVEDDMAEHEELALFEDYLEEFEKTLKGRDLEVFRLRMRSETPLTLQEIGDKYKVSRERARQIEAKILSNLREFVKNKKTIDI